MSHTVPAVFDAGVFRPLEPVDLAEGTQVVVQMPQSELAETVDEETRAAWIAYLDRMKAMPDDSSPDGLSNRDCADSKRELSGQELSRQQAAIEEMLAEIENLPDEDPHDGFSGRDHDKILYGAP